MGAFNMPPGCSPRDIPGNDAPDPTPESERVAELLTEMLTAVNDASFGEDQVACTKTVTRCEDTIVELVDNLARDLQHAKELLRGYARTLPEKCPACQGRGVVEDVEAECTVECWTCGGEPTLRQEIEAFI